MKFQRVFSEVSRGFQVRLKGVSSILKEFQGGEVYKVCQGSFNGVSILFPG